MEGEGRGKGGEGKETGGKGREGACAVLTFPLKTPVTSQSVSALLSPNFVEIRSIIV